MIDLDPTQLATVKRILAAHVPGCQVRAFGSRVTGTAREHSDLDLAVLDAGKLDPDALLRLKEAFESSDLPIRVDVVDWQAASDTFRAAVQNRFEIVQGGPK